VIGIISIFVTHQLKIFRQSMPMSTCLLDLYILGTPLPIQCAVATDRVIKGVSVNLGSALYRDIDASFTVHG